MSESVRSAAAGVDFYEVGFRGEMKALVERFADKCLHIVWTDLSRIDVHLEVTALSGGIDPYGYRLLAEGSFEHGFRQIDQGHPPEKA